MGFNTKILCSSVESGFGGIEFWLARPPSIYNYLRKFLTNFDTKILFGEMGREHLKDLK